MNELKELMKVKILGNNLQIYTNEKEKYFSAKEVGKMLDYSIANISKMVSKVDEEEKQRFCVHTKSTSAKARNQKQWFVTKDGLHELLFQSRKDIAKKFKKEVKRILNCIEENGAYIKTEKDNLWIGIRTDSKEIRKNETDTIKEFVEYAKSQGSSKPNWYYKHFTNLVRKKLDIPKDLKRDEMSQKVLLNIQALETIISMKLGKLLLKDKEYKEIYQLVKEMINNI